MLELIENEIERMHCDIVEYMKSLLSLKVCIYPYSGLETELFLCELNEKLGIKADIVYRHCDDSGDDTDCSGVPVKSFADLLKIKDRENYVYILSDKDGWQSDFWCLEWNLIPCKNIICFSQIEYYLNVINQNVCRNDDDCKIIESNIDRCQTAYELMSDERERYIFLRLLAKKITNCSFYFDVFFEDQYFNGKLIGDLENEIYLDVGAYDGATIGEFAKHCKNYKHIYAFEPETSCFGKLVKNTSSDAEQITYFNAGLFDKTGDISFRFAEYGSSHVYGVLPWDTYDVVDECYDVYCFRGDDLKIAPTFIKMDIEGAEVQAIEGLRDTLSKYKPKLAVCLYHHLADLWNIPILLHSINSSYRFKIAHHSYWVTETVLYAISD